MRRRERLKNTPSAKEDWVGIPEKDLTIQALNMKINACKWDNSLRERGLELPKYLAGR